MHDLIKKKRNSKAIF